MESGLSLALQKYKVLSIDENVLLIDSKNESLAVDEPLDTAVWHFRGARFHRSIQTRSVDRWERWMSSGGRTYGHGSRFSVCALGGMTCPGAAVHPVFEMRPAAQKPVAIKKVSNQNETGCLVSVGNLRMAHPCRQLSDSESVCAQSAASGYGGVISSWHHETENAMSC